MAIERSTSNTPIERMHDAFPDAKPSGNEGWYSARCSGHDDRSASLSFREDDKGHIIIKCHAGCSREEILKGAHLTEAALHPNGSYRPIIRIRSKLELIDLAYDKLIPWQYLFNELKIEDEYRWHGMSVVKIPYFTREGEEHTKIRVRTELSGNRGSMWDEDTPGSIIPYGLHKLAMAEEQKRLTIGEGESDAWTYWFHGLPYLGIPGASNVDCLDVKYLHNIPRIYIIQEPDKAGKQFYKKLHSHLRKSGYKGEIFVLPFQKLSGHKDPNALHKALKGKDFKQHIQDMMAHATTSGDELDRSRTPKPQTYRLSDLQKEEFPPLKWAIPDILPEGLTWLCGKPKLGKSWMLLSMMCAVAFGGVALGNVPVEEGEVLYLSLEDNKRRLKNRANIVLDNLKASDNFYYAINWPRLNEGGLEALEDWIIEHPKARLIGIDTWAKIKPQQRGQNQKLQYDEDYDALTPLQELAGKYGIAIVLVHHMRKQESDDPIDMVAGSVALQGAVDGFLLLYRKRGESDARLFITGRDIEDEQDLVLNFNQANASWTIKGNSDEVASTPERQAIIDVLKPHPEGLTLKQIADKLKKNINTTRNLIVSLRNEKKIVLQNNVYSLVTHSNPSKSSSPSNHSKVDTSGSKEVTREETGYYGNDQTIVTLNQPEKPDEQEGYYAYYGNYTEGQHSNCFCGKTGIHLVQDQCFCEDCYSRYYGNKE